MIDIRIGDCREHLRLMETASVHCVVTSPPYWGLRDYGMAEQIGLESSVAAYIKALVGVFRETRRVLRDDGTLWLNMGDAYYSPHVSGGVGANSTINSKASPAAFRDAQRAQKSSKQKTNAGSAVAGAANRRHGSTGLKPKDLIGLPWALAFALRADGWYLRQDIIWSKPNPMPESVRDRCTKAHEYLFLLSKRERYVFDQDAILEPVSRGTRLRMSQDLDAQAGSERAHGGNKSNGPMKPVLRKIPGGSRNKRSVWTIPTAAFNGTHFATFPPALVEPCILAGCGPGSTVLDPFAGAGTVGLVAQRLQRNAMLIELNPEYALMASKRIRDGAPLLADVRCGDSRVAAPAPESGPRTAHSALPVSASLLPEGEPS